MIEALNYRRIVIRTNAQREPSAITHAFTLAGSLFLLSDLFEEGTLAADSTYAEDMATFPWGTNHVTNEYLAGSDFSVRTIGADVARTDKITAIMGAGLDPRTLSFCRKRGVMPDNCGTCRKCIRTKAMFLVSTGSIPEIFADNSFTETLAKEMAKNFPNGFTCSTFITAPEIAACWTRSPLSPLSWSNAGPKAAKRRTIELLSAAGHEVVDDGASQVPKAVPGRIMVEARGTRSAR